MKLLVLSICLFSALASAQDFHTLLEKYNQAPVPTEEQLKESIWTYVGIQNNPELRINNGYENHWEMTGYKNADDSIMTYEFQNFEHPIFRFTLIKKAYLSAGDSVYAPISIGSEGMTYAFSAYPAKPGKLSDLYYVQNCKIDFGTDKNILICPTILRLQDGAPNNYSPEFNEALNKVMSIQAFSN